MYKDLIGERVTVVVASRGDNVLEYSGVLAKETEYSIEMTNTDIAYLMLNFQKGIFGGSISKYKENLDRVIINKRYIISCNN